MPRRSSPRASSRVRAGSPARPRKRKLGLHDYLLTHKKNQYKPHLFRTASITAILVTVAVLQAAYFAQIKFVLPNTSFLGAVLPSALIDLTNGDRASNGLGSVTENATLDQAAQAAADDMAAKGYFAHVSPDGTTPWDWLNQAHYHYEYAGENLAVNFTDSDQVETAWMNSPSHRANILKAQYTQVGIGVANGMYEGREATFVVQFFASPAGAAAPAQTPPPVQQAAPAKTGTGEIAIAPKPVPQTLATKQQQIAATPTQVLGAQSAQSQAAKVAQNPAQPVTTAAAPAEPVQPAHGFQTFVLKVITSPTHTLLYILLTLTALVGAAVIVELLVKVRMKYVEMTGGGLALLAVLVVLVIFNVVSAPKVQVANSTQPAAVEAGVSTI